MQTSIIFTGANNHKYFMGFLWSLMLMCSWTLYGCLHYYHAAFDMSVYDSKCLSSPVNAQCSLTTHTITARKSDLSA